MDPWWVNIWKGYSLYSVTMLGCFCTQIYLILLPKFFPNAAGRILFGWNSFCGKISERFLPPPNTNTRVRKTQRILPKQCVVHKPNNHKKYLRNSSMWHEFIVLLNIVGPDLAQYSGMKYERFWWEKSTISVSPFSLSVWGATKVGVFENISLSPLWSATVIMRYEAGMLQKFESKIFFTSLCLFEPCCKCMYSWLWNMYLLRSC